MTRNLGVQMACTQLEHTRFHKPQQDMAGPVRGQDDSCRAAAILGLFSSLQNIRYAVWHSATVTDTSRLLSSLWCYFNVILGRIIPLNSEEKKKSFENFETRQRCSSGKAVYCFRHRYALKELQCKRSHRNHRWFPPCPHGNKASLHRVRKVGRDRYDQPVQPPTHLHHAH